ncbi:MULTISPECIES: ABC transporter substrate-binding protein [Corynebacterium]|jgi:osmoprotectant transport system substrate-binding protein|nr:MULTISPECIES: ABC transporter substrate-binding protein [Corynebacterium]
MFKKVMTTVVAAAVTGSLLAGCGGGDPTSSGTGSSGDSSTLTIGSADFSESQLLATIYSHALRDAGINVTEKLGIGSREIYLEALKDGSIDMLPEYSGTYLSALDPDTTETDPAKITAELKEKVGDGLEILDVSEAENKDVVTLSSDFAREHPEVDKVSDLQGLAGDMTLAGPSEWKERYMGVAGLKEVYGLDFKSFKVLDAGGPLTLASLKSGQAQAGDMFSSDPAIEDNDLKPLEDDKNLFLPAQIVPVVRSSKITDQGREVINKVQAALTTEGLTDMNRKIADGGDLGQIADEWLKAEGLAS